MHFGTAQLALLAVRALCPGPVMRRVRSPFGACVQVCGIGRVTERLLREVADITVCGQLISEGALLSPSSPKSVQARSWCM